MKEEADYDPSKTDKLVVGSLKLNDKEAISGSMPWIIADVEEKIQTALGMDHLSSLYIFNLKCNSLVANELLDVLTCYDLPEHGLEKLSLNRFLKSCEPLEEEVMSRLASICPRLSHL